MIASFCFVIVGIVILFYFLLRPAVTPTSEEAEQQLYYSAERIVSRFMYIYDSSTKLCFVYFWEDHWHHESSTGGPAITEVACSPLVMTQVANKPKTPPSR